MTSTRSGKVSILFGAFITFVLSFQGNLFGAATQEFFEGHQRSSESLVLGRMIETQTNGAMSRGGFLGRYENPDRVKFQYETFVNNSVPDGRFVIYKQSSGLQGFFYASMDAALRLIGVESGETRLYASKLTTSSVLAVLLLLFVHFVLQNFGRSAAITLIALLAASQWMVVFSNNLYWMFFLIILPFIAVVFFLQLHSQSKTTFLLRKIYFLYSIVFAAILIKSLSGYEYISAILISTIAPLIFFAIRDSWGFKRLLGRALFVGLSGLAGFFTAILIHLTQLTYVLGSSSKALDHLWGTILKRTHGDPNTVREVYRASLESHIVDVILKYWRGHAFNLDSLMGFGGFISFGELIISLLIMSAAMTWLTFSRNGFKKYRKLNFATVAMLWFSFLSPLSWHTLAKGHSYIHGHMNHVLWYVPLLLIGFAYFGFVVSAVSANLIIGAKKNMSLALTSLVFAFIFAYSCTKYIEYESHRLLVDDLHGGLEVNSDRELSIFYDENQIVFLSKRCKRNLSARFFLHIIPHDMEDLAESRRPYRFENLDFNWSSKQIHSFTPYPFGKKSCAAGIHLPFFPLKGIRTGQFNKDGRLWETYIDLTGDGFVSDFQAFKFTDRNWVNGIHRSRSGFFTENTFANRQSIRAGDTLIFNRSGRRVIEDISYSSRFMNVFVSGEILIPELDGHPSPIKIAGGSAE